MTDIHSLVTRFVDQHDAIKNNGKAEQINKKISTDFIQAYGKEVLSQLKDTKEFHQANESLSKYLTPEALPTFIHQLSESCHQWSDSGLCHESPKFKKNTPKTIQEQCASESGKDNLYCKIYNPVNLPSINAKDFPQQYKQIQEVLSLAKLSDNEKVKTAAQEMEQMLKEGRIKYINKLPKLEEKGFNLTLNGLTTLQNPQKPIIILTDLAFSKKWSDELPSQLFRLQELLYTEILQEKPQIIQLKQEIEQALIPKMRAAQSLPIEEKIAKATPMLKNDPNLAEAYQKLMGTSINPQAKSQDIYQALQAKGEAGEALLELALGVAVMAEVEREFAKKILGTGIPENLPFLFIALFHEYGHIDQYLSTHHDSYAQSLYWYASQQIIRDPFSLQAGGSLEALLNEPVLGKPLRVYFQDMITETEADAESIGINVAKHLALTWLIFYQWLPALQPTAKKALEKSFKGAKGFFGFD